MSLVICSKDDKQELIRTMGSFINQKEPFKEIIIVDDFSKDDTKLYLEALQNKYKSIKYVVPETDQPGKKIALDTGINKAISDYLILTDADCIAYAEWGQELAKEIAPKKEIVLGYAPFLKTQNLLNKWQRFECYHSAIQYLSFALGGMAYMGVGRNLCYKKELYKRKANLESHLHIPSGDDDLSIQNMATVDNVSISLSPRSFTYSKAKEDLKTYIKQKRRHYSTASSYKKTTALALGIYSFSQICFYLTMLVLIIIGQAKIALLLYFVKIIPQWILHALLMNKLRENDLILLWPILDILNIIHYLYFVKDVFFPKTVKWK